MIWQDGPVTVHIGDALAVLQQLPAESVQCVVTSPPYWGLRDYGTAQWEGGQAGCDHLQNNWPVRGSSTLNAKPTDPASQAKRTPYKDICRKCGARRIDSQLGLEATPEEYIARMVKVFQEVRRVLRPDGTLWLNMGDSYASSGVPGKLGKPNLGGGGEFFRRNGINEKAASYEFGRAPTTPGLKPKDLVGIPWRLAFALQADGWWLRSDIVWAKPNPMPESVTDRPTKAHEYVFLLTKSARYFYDAEAVRERIGEEVRMAASFRDGGIYTQGRSFDNNGSKAKLTHGDGDPLLSGRNLRSVWTIATQPYPEAHFATFPEELARRCIAAGTSEYGCCPVCGGPWERVVEQAVGPDRPGRIQNRGGDALRHGSDGRNGNRHSLAVTTHGWIPACRCYGAKDYWDPPAIHCTVLDPFCGSGTTLAVARRLSRRAVGIELQADYLPLIQKRVSEAALPLLEAISQ